MKYSYTFLTAAALVLASPMPVEQSRASTAAASCESSYIGIFGIVLTACQVEALSGQKEARQVLSQIPDGQIQAPTHSTSVITTHKPSSLTSKPSSLLSSSPCTASASSSSKPSSPPSSSPCSTSTSASSKQSSKPSTSECTSSVSSTAKHSSTAPCANQSTTAKQSPSTPCSGPATPSSKTETHTSIPMMPPITQIGDGQIQNPGPSMRPTAPEHKPSNSMPMKPPVSQIGDGQIQNPGPSQPAATRRTFTTTTTSTSTIIACTGSSSGYKPSEQSSTRPATTPASSPSITPKTTGTPVSIIPDGQPQVPTGKPQTGEHVGACSTDSTLKLSLSNGILKDARGWQGYIAANRQFQFDNPPQDGAVITSGFSICSNGSLALNRNNIFWECLSGNFYNLYDYNIAPQCRPVALQVAQLIKC